MLLHSKPYRINSCRDAKTEENMIDLVVSYIKLIRFGCLRSVSGVWNRVLYNIQYLVVQLVTSKPSYVATRVRISAQSHELRFSLMLCPTSHNLKSGERIISWVHKIQLHGRRGKGTAESSRDKNEGKHGRRKVEKSYVTFLLCDPGWCVHKSDVQNICDDNTTHTWYIINTRYDSLLLLIHTFRVRVLSLCVCFVIPFILDVPAGVTQEEGHTGVFLGGVAWCERKSQFMLLRRDSNSPPNVRKFRGYQLNHRGRNWRNYGDTTSQPLTCQMPSPVMVTKRYEGQRATSWWQPATQTNRNPNRDKHPCQVQPPDIVNLSLRWGLYWRYSENQNWKKKEEKNGLWLVEVLKPFDYSICFFGKCCQTKEVPRDLFSRKSKSRRGCSPDRRLSGCYTPEAKAQQYNSST